MPTNDAAAYTEKLPQPAMLLQPTNVAKSAAEGPLQLQVLLTPVNVSMLPSKSSENGLVKHQGQKWQQIFDFEKMLKQIRYAEKLHLRHKSDSGSSSHSGKTLTSSSSAAAPHKPTSSLKCSRQLKQVKRLHGPDMHYYGIVPKQTKFDVVVCNVCMGIYTKMGLNNHMLQHHPTVWSTVSTKLNNSGETCNIQTTDNNQETALVSEIVGSPPSDISGTMSTCSNASSTCSSMSTTLISARHKTNSKNGATGSSSSSSTNSGRYRGTKAKHYSSSQSVHSSSPASSSASVEKAYNTHSKTSKKLIVNPVSASKTLVRETDGSLITTASDTMFSSSSNSSCSLPPTPKGPIGNNTDLGNVSSLPERIFSPANDAKDTLPNDGVTEVAATLIKSKKKVKTPTFMGQTSAESSTFSSSSSESSEQITDNCNIATNFSNEVNNSVGGSVTAKSLDSKRFDSQLAELDQAVSSITVYDQRQDGTKLDTQIDESSGGNLTATAEISYNLPTDSECVKLQTTATAQPSTCYMTQEVINDQSCHDAVLQSTGDDNSILTLEDMLDSKIINEILNTTETDINFINELDTTSQQNYNLQQQPATKRMRFDENMDQQQQQSAFQQQDTANLEQMQLSTAEQQSGINSQFQVQMPQQQQQMTTMDAMQLHQLIYQQQESLNAFDSTSGGMDSEASLQQHQQFDQAEMVEGKHLIDLCNEENDQKSNTMSSVRHDYESQTPEHFQIFNIPSLTDDNDEQHLIYEITPNQVAVMNQQRIEDFLKHANYDNAIESSNNNTPVWDIDTSSLLDFDFSLLDTVKSLTKDDNSGTMKTPSTTSTKYNEDFDSNVFMYAGIPRPLAINSFGLVKLPHASAVTFRKHLLTMRKANNSPITLGGCVNGVVGSNPTSTSATRFANGNSKTVQQYFTTPSTSGNVSSLPSSEFSIGNITITNSPTQQGSYGLQRQQSGSPLEITMNSQTNGIASTVITPQRVRPKSNANNTGMSMTKKSVIVNNAALASKTIYICNTSNANERVKCIKRAMITKLEIPTKKPHFTTKQFTDIINGNGSSSKNTLKQQLAVDTTNSQDCDTHEQQLRLNRVQQFYDRRKKLMKLNSPFRKQHQQHQQQQQKQDHQQQQQQWLLKQQHQQQQQSQQLLRNLSDNGMRVFV